MSDQPEALFLADVIENDPQSKAHHDAAAALLRRQHAEIESLKAECDALLAEVSALQSQVNAFYLGTPESRLLAMTKERDALRAALEKIARVNAMDYEYQAWAQAAIDAAREAGK